MAEQKAPTSGQRPLQKAKGDRLYAPDASSEQRRGIEGCLRILGPAAIVTVGLYVLLYLQTGTWQMLVAAGGVALAMVCLAAAYWLIKRGRLNAAGYCLIFGVMLAYGAGEASWAGATWYLLGGGLALIFLTGSMVLPRQWRAWVVAASLFGVYVWLINRLEPLPRYDAMQSVILRLYLPGLTALSAGGSAWRLARAYQHIKTIRARLLIAFVLIASLSLSAVSAASFVGGLAGGQRQVISQLESVTALKEAEIDTWLQGLQLDLKDELQRDTATQPIKTLLHAPLDSAEFQAAHDRQFSRFRQTIELRQRFEELFLVDHHGQVILSTDALQESKLVDKQDYFLQGMKKEYVSPPFYSVSAKKMLVVVARPVIDDQGQVSGILAGQANMSALNEIMRERTGLGNTGETYLVGQNHSLLTETRLGENSLYIRTQGANEAIGKRTNGSGQYAGFRGAPVIGVYHWLPQLQVTLLAEQEQAEAFRTTYTLLGVNVGVALAFALLAAFASLLITRSIAVPLAGLAETAVQIAAGDLTRMAKMGYIDEVDTLARAFNSMTAQLRDLIGNLEQQVAERTSELVQRSKELEKLNQTLRATAQREERRAAQLAASAQVAHAASQVRDLEQLLPQVTRLISEAFGFYHVGVFIVDEMSRFAVLRAANSEGGQRMLARSHKLAVGKQGIVGYVTGTGQPRIALDVGADAVHFDNPDLPHTHSEMALPLQIGNQVFGALDVQSIEANAFSAEDVAVLSTLADQIAIAIDNARLFAQSQNALQEAQEAQKRFLRQEWGQLMPTLPTTSHEYRASGVPRVGDAPLPEIEQALQQNDAVTVQNDGKLPARTALAVPIKLRDQAVGVIDLHETDVERVWTADDIALVTAVADQAALALENARLFEQAQQRARREQLVTQIATKVRAAPDMESILRTGVQEIRRVLGASHGVVRLKTAEPLPDENKQQTG